MEDAIKTPARRVLRIVLNLPPSDCAPNLKSGRSHWRHKAKASRSYRFEAAMAAHGQPPLTPPVEVRAVFYTGPHCVLGRSDGCYRPLDTQNAISALKAAIDGIVDAGVIPNDRAETLLWGRCQIKREGGPSVLIALAEVEA